MCTVYIEFHTLLHTLLIIYIYTVTKEDIGMVNEIRPSLVRVTTIGIDMEYRTLVLVCS